MNVKTQSDAHPAQNEGKADSESLGSFAWFLVKVVVAVLIFRTVFFAPFSIPSESMLPRLWNGDYLLASKWSYGISSHSLPFGLPLIPGRILASEPERGDVVIFKHPLDGTDYIKRVIALPGDTIAIADGQLVLNGEPVLRQRLGQYAIPMSVNTSCAWGGRQSLDGGGLSVCRYDRYRETMPGGASYEVLDFGNVPADTFAPIIVPEGHMFVMGDNRDNSRDSRFPARRGDAVGLVPQDNLVGKAAVLIWSTDGSAEWAKPWTWFTAARWGRIGSAL